MKDDKYVKKKKDEMYLKLVDCKRGDLWPLLEGFIRTIVKDMKDKYWAQEQYYLDTIKTLKEGKPKVGVDIRSWFYKNCKSQRKRGAKICQSCPFRKMIEEQEAGVEVEE